jgi:hypothetical protein
MTPVKNRGGQDQPQEDTINSDHDSNNNNEDMPKNYYKTKREAINLRRKGDRIYYEPEKEFYMIRPKKRDFSDLF